MQLPVRKIAVAGLLGSVSVIMGYVFPVLGFIPVPTAAGSATLMHIPAILGGVTEGPVVGGFVGFVFGLLSFLRATNPAFADPLISIVPRVLIGVLAAYTFAGLRRTGITFRLAASAVVGTLVNTGLVLGLMVVRRYLAPGVAVGVGLLHGLPEIVVACVAVMAIGLGLARAGIIGKDGHNHA